MRVCIVARCEHETEGGSQGKQTKAVRELHTHAELIALLKTSAPGKHNVSSLASGVALKGLSDPVTSHGLEG